MVVVLGVINCRAFSYIIVDLLEFVIIRLLVMLDVAPHLLQCSRRLPEEFVVLVDHVNRTANGNNRVENDKSEVLHVINILDLDAVLLLAQ